MKRCPHCQSLLVTYKQHLRYNLIEPLQLLAVQSEPLTVRELSDLFVGDDPHLATEISKHFASLRFWNLIQKAGEGYKVTIFGARFLKGEQRIPKWVYTQRGDVVTTPEDGEEAPWVSMEEIRPLDLSSKRRHLDEAVATPDIFQLSLV